MPGRSIKLVFQHVPIVSTAYIYSTTYDVSHNDFQNEHFGMPGHSRRVVGQQVWRLNIVSSLRYDRNGNPHDRDFSVKQKSHIAYLVNASEVAVQIFTPHSE